LELQPLAKVLMAVMTHLTQVAAVVVKPLQVAMLQAVHQAQVVTVLVVIHLGAAQHQLVKM
jgi:hypothetical protein